MRFKETAMTASDASKEPFFVLRTKVAAGKSCSADRFISAIAFAFAFTAVELTVECSM
jgi:hypothetical protein